MSNERDMDEAALLSTSIDAMDALPGTGVDGGGASASVEVVLERARSRTRSVRAAALRASVRAEMTAAREAEVSRRVVELMRQGRVTEALALRGNL